MHTCNYYVYFKSNKDILTSYSGTYTLHSMTWLSESLRGTPGHSDRHFMNTGSCVKSAAYRVPRNWDLYFVCLFKPGHFQVVKSSLIVLYWMQYDKLYLNYSSFFISKIIKVNHSGRGYVIQG